ALADDDLAVESARRAGDEQPAALLGGLDRPHFLAGPRIDRDQPSVGRSGIDLAVPPGDAADAPIGAHLAAGAFGGVRIVAPQLPAGRGVHGMDDAVAAR